MMEGGDCPYWRRRFFRLQGTKLTAYHEHTNQKRAVINLSKAVRLVDDRRTLLADPVAPTSPAKPSGGNRRKSAFTEEDDGYQYVEEGFRIRFANGETIDFYADSKAAKALTKAWESSRDDVADGAMGERRLDGRREGLEGVLDPVGGRLLEIEVEIRAVPRADARPRSMVVM